MSIFDLKIFIKFDESINYKELDFLGSKTFNTLDYLNKKYNLQDKIPDAGNLLSSASPYLEKLNKYQDMLQEYYLFPVTPESIDFKGNGKWEKVETLAGWLKYKERPALQSIKFKSFISARYYRYLHHYMLDPFTTFLLFKWLEKTDVPIRFIFVGKMGRGTLQSLTEPIDLNFLATIENFDSSFEANGDLEFSIDLEEYQEFEGVELENEETNNKMFFKIE